MKKCLVVPLVGLAISLALPTYAQQKDLADPQTTQKILANVKAALEAHNNGDAAAMAAGYTRDAVFLTPDRPIIGRQAIQKWFTDFFQSSPLHPKNSMSKVDGNAFHLIGTAGNEVPGGRLGPNPGNRHARQQEFCTTTGRNAVPDC